MVQSHCVSSAIFLPCDSSGFCWVCLLCCRLSRATPSSGSSMYCTHAALSQFLLLLPSHFAKIHYHYSYTVFRQVSVLNPLFLMYWLVSQSLKMNSLKLFHTLCAAQHRTVCVEVRRVSWCCESGRWSVTHGFFTLPGFFLTTSIWNTWHWHLSPQKLCIKFECV